MSGAGDPSLATAAARAFIDTNVIVYLLSGDVAKADRAEKILAAGGVVSVQVLNEFASLARRKLALSWLETREVLNAVRVATEVTPLTLAIHERALNIAEASGFNFYDAAIVAAAIETQCMLLLTEDLQHGQVIGGVRIENPFLGA